MSHLVPVVLLVYLFTAHAQQNCTVLQYCTSRYIKNDDHHERTTVEIPFNIKDCAIVCRWSLVCRCVAYFSFNQPGGVISTVARLRPINRPTNRRRRRDPWCDRDHTWSRERGGTICKMMVFQPAGTWSDGATLDESLWHYSVSSWPQFHSSPVLSLF